MRFRAKYALRALLAKRVSPIVKDNTFFVWEPCTYSHAEVVPGYVKYLRDLGFHVSVLVHPSRIDEGLFSRLNDPGVSVNRLSQAQTLRYFKENGLLGARGVLITTARKIGARDSYGSEYSLFANRASDQQVLLVEHDVKRPVDCGVIDANVLTLRKVEYKNIRTPMVNPHYFGDVSITPKSPETRFITIGALRAKRRNTRLLLDATEALHRRGVRNFRVTVIGRGNLRGLPAHLRAYFDIKGRVDFARLYAEMEAADFFLPLLDADNPRHERYLRTGTSGNFQLIYGFAKPCLIADKFAAQNGFNALNSIGYTDNAALAQSMIDAIAMTPTDYNSMQDALKRLAAAIYDESLDNLRTRIRP